MRRFGSPGGKEGGTSSSAPAAAPGKRTLTGELRRKATGAASSAPPAEAFERATRAPAAEVPYRADMEAAFGADFSGVSAHLGGDEARAGLDALGAHAATDGQAIAFADAQPSRDTVAHELAHVVQAGGAAAPVQGKGAVSSASDPAEREADQAAAAVVAGERPHISQAPSAALHRQERPGGGAAPEGRPVTDQLAMTEVSISFQLPGGRKLGAQSGVDILTRSATTVTVRVRGGTLEVYATPSIFFDVTYPGENVLFYGATWTFANAQCQVDVGRDTEGWGFVDYQQDVRTGIASLLRSGLGNTPAGRPGYNPATDPQIQNTLQAVAAAFRGLPAGAGAPGAVAAGDLGNVSMGGAFTARTEIRFDQDGDGVHIPAGGGFRVSVLGRGTAAEIQRGANPQAMAQAARISEIQLSSQSIEILHRGSAVARLDEARVLPGGRVVVERIQLLGSARTAADIETLLRFLGGALDAHSRGAPDGLAVAIGAQGAEAQVVPGMTRRSLEEGLTRGVQRLLRENATAIPGLNLADLLGTR